VKCQEYETKIFSSRLKLSRNVKWVNTNKLLSLDHCEGIKTGVTPTAGPCMAASFQRDNFNVIIVILNAKNKTKRFQEVKNLYDWAEKQINTNNA
jgi:D-alanyl-D-alanine carboxypeptidase